MTKHFSHSVFRRRMRAFLSKTRPDLVTHALKSRELKRMCAEDINVRLLDTKAKSDLQLFDILANQKLPPMKRKAPRPVEMTAAAAKAARASFYDSDEWRRLRYRALKASNGCCQCCGVSAANGAQLHVDHVKPRSKFPELELEFTNLQVLCRDCNLGKGAWDQTDWRRAAE